MKILLGRDPLVLVSPDLSHYITTPGPSNPTPSLIITRGANADRLKKTQTTDRRADHKPEHAIAVWHEMEKWLADNQDQAADYSNWWETSGKSGARQLRDWMQEQAKPQKHTPAKPQDAAPPGDPANQTHNRPPRKNNGPRPAKVPPLTIEQSAEQAGIWLAERWPRAVKEQGYSAFVQARAAEVIAGNFPAPYWQELDRRDPQAAVATATGTLNPNWNTPPFNDPLRKRTVTRYGKTSLPYAMPAAGTEGASPAPGFKGGVIGDELHDQYLAYWIENYDFPKKYEIDDMTPIFFDGYSTHHIIADKPPSKVQYGVYSLPIIYSDNPAAAWPKAALPHFGRRYNWTTKISPGGTVNYAATMRRHWQLDCRILAMLNGDDDNRAEKLQLHFAPLAAMGRYYGKASQVKTIYQLENCHAYVAKPETRDYPPTPTLYGFTPGFGWSTHDVGLFPAQMGQWKNAQAWYSNTPPGKPANTLRKITVELTISRSQISVGPPTNQALGWYLLKEGPRYSPYGGDGLYGHTAEWNVRDFGAVGGDSGFAYYWLDAKGIWRTMPARPGYLPGGLSGADWWKRYIDRGGIA